MLSSFTFHQAAPEGGHERGTEENLSKSICWMCSSAKNTTDIQILPRCEGEEKKIMKCGKRFFWYLFPQCVIPLLLLCLASVEYTQDPEKRKKSSLFPFLRRFLPIAGRVVLKYFISSGNRILPDCVCQNEKTSNSFLMDDGCANILKSLGGEKSHIYLINSPLPPFQLAVPSAAARKTDTAISPTSACKYPDFLLWLSSETSQILVLTSC